MSDSPAATGAAPDHRLIVRAVLRTDVGKVRTENQDFATLTFPDEGEAGRLMIVADGMGGHRGGATASRLAAETVKEEFLAGSGGEIPDLLRSALLRANTRIWNEAQSNADLRGMGTTTSALVVRNRQGWFAHVGDSRIYLVRNGEIQQLTDDHSLVASMVREGLLTAEEAENHPRRNVLQRSMGVSEDVEVDVRGPIDLLEGDTFIICSDGLHGVVKEDELREVAGLPVQAAAEEFVRRALERGAPDNVTVIVARVEREGAADAEDRVLFDDTLREEAVPLPAGAESLPAAIPLSAPTEPGTSDAPPAPDAAQVDEPAVAPDSLPEPERGKPISVVKWTLIFVLLLGAAGGGIFWAQQQRFARQAQSSSR